MGQFFKMFFAALLAGVVLMILPFILMIGFFSALASLGSQPEPMVKPASTLVIDLSVPIMDRAVEDPMAIFTSFSTMAGNVSMPVSLREMTETIAYAAQDENIEGISLTGEGFGGGMAQLVAIRKALDEFKASGKYVTAYANLYSQGDYIVKSLADKVFLNPNGTVDFKGMSMTSMFFKGFEQKYGVGVQVFRTGKFKSAVEPFLLEKMSPENRRQSMELISTIWDTLSLAAAQSRGYDREWVDRVASQRLGFTASGALECGLVDSLLYAEQYDAYLDSLGGENRVKYAEYARHVAGRLGMHGGEDRVAVIYAQGDIVYGKGTVSQISEEALRKGFEKAAEDDRVKAVVLRVNSPGGVSITADNIWKMVEDLKSGKPVVVSMGDYAASGGYYISCGADYIFAEPTTITGSIGVFAYIPNVEELAARNGITTDQVSIYPNSTDPTILTPVSPGLSKIMQNSVEQTYSQFVSRVAQGRGMTWDQVDSIAQGRVWSGVSALQIGLVDEIGGLDRAIAKAADLAGAVDYSVVEYPKTSASSLEQVLSILNSDAQVKVKDLVGEDLYAMYRTVRQVSESGEPVVLTRLPYGVEVRL